MSLQNILKFYIVVSIVLITNGAIAQEGQTVTLSLDDALISTMSNNQQIKIMDFELSASLQDVEKMKNIYLPNISLSSTALATNNPLNAFGTKLLQGDISQADFSPDDLNEPSAITNLNTKIMIQQPIINSDIAGMKKALAAKSEAYRYQFIRTKEVLKNEVTKAYLQLQLMYEVKAVLSKAKTTAEANLKLANDNLQAGYIQHADVLAVEVHINDITIQIIQSDNNIQNISDQLSFMMGKGYGDKYLPQEKLVFMDNSAVLANDIPENRSDLKAMESQVKAQKYMLESTEKTNLPRLNAFGSYELNNSLEFDASQHGFIVGVQASWLIFDGKKNKNDARKAKIELNKSKTQLEQKIAQTKLEYVIAKRKMTEAKQKIQLAEKAIEQSKESLRIKTDRFAQGLERTTEILIAETTVSQKEMNYKEAIFQYQMAYATLLLILEQKN